VNTRITKQDLNLYGLGLKPTCPYRVHRVSLMPGPPLSECRPSAQSQPVSHDRDRRRREGIQRSRFLSHCPLRPLIFHTNPAVAGQTNGTNKEKERKLEAPARKIQTQTLGEDATVATAVDAAGLVPADLERRVMAAVKASEARGDPPLLQVVELSRIVAVEGAGTLSSADLARILVSNLCFAHNSPSLWKLLGQAVVSRLLCPLHVLALLTPRCVRQRSSLAPHPTPGGGGGVLKLVPVCVLSAHFSVGV
jgi:hypothetical protein